MTRRSVLASQTTMVFAVAVTAFNLGRYSVEFSGSVLAWIAVIFSTLGLATLFVALTLAVWERGAKKQD
jgi:hypothetical protein